MLRALVLAGAAISSSSAAGALAAPCDYSGRWRSSYQQQLTDEGTKNFFANEEDNYKYELHTLDFKVAPLKNEAEA